MGILKIIHVLCVKNTEFLSCKEYFGYINLYVLKIYGIQNYYSTVQSAVVHNCWGSETAMQ